MPHQRNQSYRPEGKQPARITGTAKDSRKSIKDEKKPERSWKRKLLYGILAILCVALIGLGWVGWKFFSNTTKVFGGTPGGNIIATFSPSQLETQNGRVNILLAGTSVDDPHHPGADLTDSIIVASVDTKHHTAALISIPRDLWVSIPGYGYQKINFAYHWGNVTDFHKNDYPDGGIGLLQEIIESDIGIPINYYATVNYAAIRNAVNAVGGIQVCIDSPDARGLYDPNISRADGGPLKLPNGCQHLNGQTALNLARARGDSPYSYGFPHSDFDRTKHQRMIIIALEQKIMNFSVLANPFRLGSLLDAIGNNVTTNLNIGQARRLTQTTAGIGSSDIKSVSFSNDSVRAVTGYTTPGGLLALIPTSGIGNYASIQTYLKSLGIEAGR